MELLREGLINFNRLVKRGKVQLVYSDGDVCSYGGRIGGPQTVFIGWTQEESA
jgi:hypothetical protein